MATRKQRRRREKEHRHEYDVVYLDDAGNEVEPPLAEKPQRGEKGRAPKPAPSQGRFGARGAQPPSWRRVTKRGFIFAPIFLATVLLLGQGKITFAGAIVQTCLLLLVFIPFSYLMDRFVWRSHQKRLARASSGARPAPKR
jgi:hypothetical protein